MIGATDQARALLRLRAARMNAAERELTVARAKADAARRAQDDAETSARDAGEILAAGREALPAQVNDAAARLALLDRSLFRHAVARTAADAAAQDVRACSEEEAARRRSLVLARARHDILADRARQLARRVELAREERAMLEMEEVRRR